MQRTEHDLAHLRRVYLGLGSFLEEMNGRGEFRRVRQTACWRGSRIVYLTEPQGRKQNVFASGFLKNTREMCLSPVVTARACRRALSGRHPSRRCLGRFIVGRESARGEITAEEPLGSPCHLFSDLRDVTEHVAEAPERCSALQLPGFWGNSGEGSSGSPQNGPQPSLS